MFDFATDIRNHRLSSVITGSFNIKLKVGDHVIIIVFSFTCFCSQDSVIAFPVNVWSIDYIAPKFKCIRKDEVYEEDSNNFFFTKHKYQP